MLSSILGLMLLVSTVSALSLPNPVATVRPVVDVEPQHNDVIIVRHHHSSTSCYTQFGWDGKEWKKLDVMKNGKVISGKSCKPYNPKGMIYQARDWKMAKVGMPYNMKVLDSNWYNN